jgi:hypothetical protein
MLWLDASIHIHDPRVAPNISLPACLTCNFAITSLPSDNTSRGLYVRGVLTLVHARDERLYFGYTFGPPPSVVQTQNNSAWSAP